MRSSLSADEEHTELDCFGRLYQLDGYEGETEKTYEFFELYSQNGWTVTSWMAAA